MQPVLCLERPNIQNLEVGELNKTGLCCSSPTAAPCLQAKRVIAAVKAHESAVTCVHWVHVAAPVTLQEASPASVLATGAADGHISVWRVHAFRRSAAFTLIAELKATGGDTSRTVLAPVTGFDASTTVVAGKCAGTLASVAGDGCILLWRCSDVEGSGGWHLDERVEVPRHVIQNCVALSHLPGHPTWCAASVRVVALGRVPLDPSTGESGGCC